jgi:hypothetical protein
VDELLKRVDGLTTQGLLANEPFVTAVLHATQIAMRSHQVDKLQALKTP